MANKPDGKFKDWAVRAPIITLLICSGLGGYGAYSVGNSLLISIGVGLLLIFGSVLLFLCICAMAGVFSK